MKRKKKILRFVIDIDDVIRDLTNSLSLNYFKYCKGKEIEFDVNNLKYVSNDIYSPFKFDSIEERNNFLFVDYVFEIFASAQTKHQYLTGFWNIFQEEVLEDYDQNEDIEISFIACRENHLSIQATFFFLSKACCRVRKVLMPKTVKEVWKNSDVLVTANPEIIKKKPKGKTVIKINTEYNKHISGDYNYDNIVDFIREENKITFMEILKLSE
jgi:hypothetical protein